MRMVPVVKSSDLDRSVRFYTGVLDFERKWPEYAEAETAKGVADLIKDGAELQGSRHNQRLESPVHTGPVDQTWGLREFCLADPDGNGFCFCAPIRGN